MAGVCQPVEYVLLNLVTVDSFRISCRRGVELERQILNAV
jgi:hypothetical protein